MVTRTVLDAQFHEINAGIVQLGTLVGTALEQALQALQSGDQALCDQVIESDTQIDDLRFKVEQSAFYMLALQRPLAGQNLRFLSSIPLITAGLERVGDNAAGITKLLLLMPPVQARDTNQVHIDPAVMAERDQKHLSNHFITEDPIVSQLLDLGQEACRVLRGTMQAFEESDTHAARRIWQEDDVVDVRYHLVRHDLMTMLSGVHAIPALQQDALILQRMTYWLWIAHNLERIGDHCTNICERIVYILEGVVAIPTTEAE